MALSDEDERTHGMYSAFVETQSGSDHISIQGTLYFMATEILDTYVAHDVRHDLESFGRLLSKQ